MESGAPTDPVTSSSRPRSPNEGGRTLETGCGISTVLFAMWAAEHVCVVPWPREADACREYLQQHGLPDHVTFEVGWSDEVLPRLSGPPLDLVLVDGGHGFPAPILDWYYAASRLREGGSWSSSTTCSCRRCGSG